MQRQFELSIERNQSFSGTIWMITGKMFGMQMFLNHRKRSEPQDLIVIEAKIAAKMFLSHMSGQIRVIECLERANRTSRMPFHVRSQLRAAICDSLRREQAFCGGTNQACHKVVGGSNVSSEP
jgi:hypothetical protein